MPRPQYSERTGSKAVERPLLIWQHEGRKQGEYVLWPERPVTIGRDATSTIPIDSPYVSKNHAVLAYRGGKWTLEDLGSANGTQVNGNPIRVHFDLRPGDRIEIGDHALLLVDAGKAGAESGKKSGGKWLRLAFVAVGFGGILVFMLMLLSRSGAPPAGGENGKAIPTAQSSPSSAVDVSPRVVDTALINQVLDRARRTGVAEADALLDEGVLNLDSGRFRDAAQLLAASLARKPNDMRTKSRLSDAQRLLERSIGEATAEADLANSQLRYESARLAWERILAMTYPGDARYMQAQDKLKKLGETVRNRPEQ